MLSQDKQAPRAEEMLPSYIALYRSGQLVERVQRAHERLAACTLCPRHCGADRLHGEKGICRTGRKAVVSSFHAHFGEEAPLTGRRGSGTIFFTWCSLRCQYCQNYAISQLGEGDEVDAADLAVMMLALQRQGCHNINLVTPSHVVPQILAALEIAVAHGLTIPLVYNSSGYDSIETLALLDGIIDIYMPDMKYADPDVALRLSGVKDYPAINRAAVKEMHRQVGDLVLDEQGIARHGLLVRHLVLPNRLAGTADIVRFLATQISRNTYINIMDQYRPCYRAADIADISRPITFSEYKEAVELALAQGLTRLDRPRRLPAR